MDPIIVSLAQTLNLPSKTEEFDMFTTSYDVIAIFDRYLPLAEFILDEYACPNDEVSMHVEESIYMTMIGSIANFRRTKKYETNVPFSQLLAAMIYSFMEEYEQEGKVYKISKSVVMK